MHSAFRRFRYLCYIRTGCSVSAGAFVPSLGCGGSALFFFFEQPYGIAQLKAKKKKSPAAAAAWCSHIGTLYLDNREMLTLFSALRAHLDMASLLICFWKLI